MMVALLEETRANNRLSTIKTHQTRDKRKENKEKDEEIEEKLEEDTQAHFTLLLD